MSTHTTILATAIAALLLAPAAFAAPQAAGAATGAPQIPGVALSHDGEHLAWINARNGTARLMLASWTGSNAHAVALPGNCPAAGVRWAPRWDTLAVMTRCSAGANGTPSAHGAIWIVDVHSGAAPRKIANIDGYASAMQWKNTGKDIAFLYRPATGPDAHSQVVAAVGAKGGPFQILTPATWNVHAFRLSRLGNDMAFTATSTPNQPLPALYAMGRAGPKLVFDPNTATGEVHGLQIGLVRYPAYLIGFLACSPGATVDNLYTISPNGGGLVNRTATNKIKPSWFTMNHRQVIATRVVDGKVQLIKYRMGFSWVLQQRLWFSLPGTIGDGREPYGVSISYKPGYWRRVAFVQTVPGKPPVVRSGLLSTQPPPVVASADVEVASTAQ